MLTGRVTAPVPGSDSDPASVAASLQPTADHHTRIIRAVEAKQIPPAARKPKRPAVLPALAAAALCAAVRGAADGKGRGRGSGTTATSAAREAERGVCTPTRRRWCRRKKSLLRRAPGTGGGQRARARAAKEA